MKGYIELASRNLRKNKQNTLVCIIGVLIGAIIMTTASIIYNGESSKSSDEVKKIIGLYDVKFQGLNKEQVEKLKNDKRVNNLATYKKLGVSEVGSDGFKEYFELLALSDDAYNNIFNIDIMAGRKPENSNEIMLDNAIAVSIGNGVKIGDNISFNVLSGKVSANDCNQNEYFKSIRSPYKMPSVIEKSEKKTYKLVGVFQSPEENKKQAINMFTKLTATDIKEMSNIDMFATLKIKDVFLEDSISKDLGIEYIPLKASMLPEGSPQSQVNWPDTSEMKSNDGLAGLGLALITGIITVFVFGIIYNSFNISIGKRLKQFGVLRAVGATRSQLGKIIFYEAFVVYIIGLSLGLVFGVINTKVLLSILSKIFKLDFSYVNFLPPIEDVAVITLIMLFIVMLAANKALFKDTKITPIQAMSESLMLNVEAVNKVENNAKINKIFDIEGELSYKNLSRNRKRNATCLKSIAVSMILIIFFFSQMSFYKKETTFFMPSSNWDIKYSRVDKSFSKEDISKFKSISGVENVYVDRSISSGVPIEKGKLNNDLIASYKNYKEIINAPERSYNGYYGVKTLFRAVDENTLNIYKDNLKEGDLDYSKLKNDGIIIVNSGTTDVLSRDMNIVHNFTDMEKILKVKVGDKVKVPLDGSLVKEEDMKNYFNGGAVDTSKFKEFTVVGTVNKDALRNTMSTRKLENLTEDITFITANEVFDKLNVKTQNNLVIKTNTNGDREKTVKEIREYASANYDSYSDLYAKKVEYQNDVNTTLCWNINFEINILIIVIVNIINTFNANILVRKKELGHLRAIGMEYKQINKMLLLETAFLGLLAGILGLIFGAIPGGLCQMSMSGEQKPLYGTLLLIACLTVIALIIICILSAIRPIGKLKKLSIVDNIKTE